MVPRAARLQADKPRLPWTCASRAGYLFLCRGHLASGPGTEFAHPDFSDRLPRNNDGFLQRFPPDGDVGWLALGSPEEAINARRAALTDVRTGTLLSMKLTGRGG